MHRCIKGSSRKSHCLFAFGPFIPASSSRIRFSRSSHGKNAFALAPFYPANYYFLLRSYIMIMCQRRRSQQRSLSLKPFSLLLPSSQMKKASKKKVRTKTRLLHKWILLLLLSKFVILSQAPGHLDYEASYTLPWEFREEKENFLLSC